MTDQKKMKEIWARLVAKAWLDPKFEKKLLANPVEIFQEENIEVPGNTKIHIIKNTENDWNFVIPVKPKGELKEEELKKFAAGDNCICST